MKKCDKHSILFREFPYKICYTLMNKPFINIDIYIVNITFKAKQLYFSFLNMILVTVMLLQYNILCYYFSEYRVILFRVIPLLGVLLGSMHSGSYQYRPTGLYFEEWMYIFKIKTSGVVLVAS